MHRSSAFAAIGVACVCAPAFADHASFHGTLVGDVAATDNVFAAQRENAEPDVYMQVRPGMLFAYDSPRFIQELTAEAEFLEYIAHSDKPSVTFTAAWQGFITPGPRTQMTLGVNASEGQLNAMATRTAPDQTGVNVLPPGLINTRQGGANEYLSYQIGKDTRIGERVYGTWIATQDPDKAVMVTTDAYDTGASLSLDHTFQHDALAIEAGGQFVYLKRLDPLGVQMGSRLDQQVNPRVVATWRHDFNREWSLNADGGGVYVNPVGTDPYNPTDKRRAEPFPVFGALLAYTEQWGRATFSARRSVTPNLFIAQNTVDDAAIATFAMPLPWLDDYPHLRLPKLVGLGSLGFNRTQLVDPEMGDLLGKFYVAHLDVGVGYTPKPGQTYGLRYTLLYQTGNSTATMIIPSYYANTIFFTFALRYPDRVAATVPRRTQSLRSDRADLAPTGAEPVVPDPAESLPDQGGDDEGGGGDER
ncbi:MAG TPA: hypothetical protein VLT45_26985 [Kofleriaceae bacterium]|nr:hypothetical protein [Kofleriaceae bacterium]